MKNAVIYNKKTDTINIDLVGEFGDGFWGEEITKDKIINVLKDHETSDIVANLSSLGGSVDTALAARDWIMMHKGHTKVRMLGRNASASTFFSTGFDEAEISESGMFLIHNVWGAAVGGAEDFRKIADDFETHNEIIVDMYHKKTGKPKDNIRELMKEDKWITAKEAKDFGFVDNIFVPSKKEAKYNTIQQTIYNNYLPKLKQEQMTVKQKGIVLKDEASFFEKIGNYFKPEIKDISEESKKDYEAKLLEASETENELKAKIAELEKNENSETLKNKETEIEMLKNEVSELTNKLAAIIADKTEPKSGDDKLNIGDLSKEELSWQNDAKKMIY